MPDIIIFFSLTCYAKDFQEFVERCWMHRLIYRPDVSKNNSKGSYRFDLFAVVLRYVCMGRNTVSSLERKTVLLGRFRSFISCTVPRATCCLLATGSLRLLGHVASKALQIKPPGPNNHKIVLRLSCL